MTHVGPVGPPIATVNTHELNSRGWNLIRLMFPHFVEEMELGKLVRKLMKDGHYTSLHIEHHRSADGRASSYEFDIYPLDARPGPDDTPGLHVSTGPIPFEQ
jgi:hypothetical protein